MKRCKLLLLSILIAAAMIYHCTYSVAGGSSDTEVSASISGVVHDTLGNVIPGANIRLRPSDYLPGDTLLSGFSTEGIKKFDGISNDDGTFSIDSIARGDYVLEVLSGDSSGMVRQVYIDSPMTVCAVLAPFGTVAGDVDMYQIPGINEKTNIELFGTEYKFKPDTTGHFSMFLPYGPYRMRLSADSLLVNDMELHFYLEPHTLYHCGTLRMASYAMPCFNYFCDSLTVRTLLDEAGHSDITVEQVSNIKYGRIYKLNLRGITLGPSISSLAQLNALEELDLGNTGISDSCRFVMSLWKLESLLLDSNQITGVSQGFGMLTKINLIDLSYNNLTALPEQMSYTRPWFVNLNGNSLCSLSENVKEWAERYAPGWSNQQNCDVPDEEGGAEL